MLKKPKSEEIHAYWYFRKVFGILPGPASLVCDLRVVTQGLALRKVLQLL